MMSLSLGGIGSVGIGSVGMSLSFFLFFLDKEANTKESITKVCLHHTKTEVNLVFLYFVIFILFLKV